MEFKGLSKLYEKYVPLCVDMIVEGVVEGRLGQRLKGVIPLTNLNLVTQLIKMLDALLAPDELEDPLELESLFMQASSSSSSSSSSSVRIGISNSNSGISSIVDE